MTCGWLRFDAWHGDRRFCEKTDEYIDEDDCANCEDYEEDE